MFERILTQLDRHVKHCGPTRPGCANGYSPGTLPYSQRMHLVPARRCDILARMSLLAPLHPRFVHFPIALLLAGSVVALVYLFGRQRPPLAAFAWISLGLGWLALFPVVLTGLIDQNQASRDQVVVAVLNPHIAVGIALIVVYGMVMLERLRSPHALDDPRRRTLLVLLLVLGIGLVVLEGWLGGKLVYDLGVGVQKA